MYDTETGKISIVEVVGIASINEDSVALGVFEEGDIIKKMIIDGEEISITREFQVRESMFAARVGSTVIFKIERNGSPMELSFPITEDMVIEF